jgi:hypothetical protein
MDIHGIWCAMRRQKSGYTYTEQLAFLLPDHTGTYEVYDWTLQYYDTFAWEASAVLLTRDKGVGYLLRADRAASWLFKTILVWFPG